MGHGIFLTKSSKQKLNTKSSTEAKLVGATEYLPHAIWVKSFLLVQGQPVKSQISNHDNMSSINLEKNGQSGEIIDSRENIKSITIPSSKG